MAKDKQSYDVIIKEIKEDLQKMSSTETNLDDAINLFEENLEKLQTLKMELDKYKVKVQKVLANNKIVDFEE